MGNFYTDVICKSPLFHTTQIVKDMGLLEPVTRAAVRAVIADAAAIGHRLIVTETYRSKERQEQLFNQRPPATRLKAVGIHHYGLAADFGMIVNGRMDPVGEHYAFLIPLAEKHSILSGIDWGLPNIAHDFHDWDHVQRIPLKRQASLFAGAWYPAADYNPLADLGRAPILEAKKV